MVMPTQIVQLERFEALPRGERTLQSLAGTLQRVDYQKKEFSLIAQGRVWRLALAPDCQLRFDDQPAILRCFHTLDQVEVLFVEGNPKNLAKAVHGWENRRL